MKKALAVFAIAMSVVMVGMWYCGYSVLAERTEQTSQLPGDELIPNSIGSITHAITIDRPARDVWPWLAQMGSDRGGWYAYDFIDNGGNASTRRIIADYQNIAVGTVFPALPGVNDVFTVVRDEPPHALVLSWRSPQGAYFTTWAFVLEEPEAGRTRLLVRGRIAPDYRPYGLPTAIAEPLAFLVHGVMQRKQLLGIKERAEATQN